MVGCRGSEIAVAGNHKFEVAGKNAFISDILKCWLPIPICQLTSGSPFLANGNLTGVQLP